MVPESEEIVDVLFFTNDGKSVENKYSITKELLRNHIFVLK